MDPMSDEFQRNMKKDQKLAESTLVEHKAYLLADAASKNLEIDKYSRQILNQMEKEDAKTNKNEVFIPFCGTWNNYFNIKNDTFFDCQF